MPRSDSRMVRSSSTTRMLGILAHLRYGGLFRLLGNRQLHHKPGAQRLVFFYANGAAMIFNNTAHDGESQAGAALLGREIRKEEILFYFAGHSVARGGHHR